MSLTALRTAIVDSITLEVTSFRTVQAHGGRFDATELKRWAVRAPAAMISCLGSNNVTRQGSQAVGEMRFGIFIVTGGTSSSKRDVDALILVEQVAALVSQNVWAYENAKAPESMRIDNLYSGNIDQQGVALWAVTWIQKVDLGIYEGFSDLDDLNRVDAKYDLVPADGVNDFLQTIWLQGEFMSTYGHINISSSAATAIAVVDTYQKAAGTTELNLNDDFDMPEVNRLRHTGTVAKPFIVSVSASVTVSADAKVTLAIAKNGVVDEDTEIEQECTLAGGAEAFSLKHIVSLDENEYVEVWVKADDTIGVTLTKMNMIAAAS